jgi:hypothetical protein
MDVYLSGWRRHCGENYLVGKSLRKAEIGREPQTHYANESYVFKDSERSNGARVVYRSHVGSLRLNGDYLLTMELTIEDIGVLVAEAFKDKSFDEFASFLSEAVKARVKANHSEAA